MRIIITGLDGEELVNEEFITFDIDGKTLSFRFINKSIVLGASLDNAKIYYATFIDAEQVGLVGKIMVKYLTYMFNASTAFMTNEFGDKVSTIQTNANNLQLLRY